MLIDDLTFSTLEYKRIKIFTESGRRWADVSIPYVPGQWEIKDLQARTILPDGTIINFGGKVFEQLIVKARGVKVLETRFSLPSVQPGCIIEYMFRRAENAEYVHEDDWEVQSDLYTRLGVYSIRPTPWFTLNWRKHRLPGTLKPEKQPDGAYRLEIKDIPGLTKENLMPPEKVARARISFYFTNKPATTPEQFWKSEGANWDKGLENFINKKKFLESIVSETLRPEDPPETKLRKLYERAQQIQNVDYEKDSESKRKRLEKLGDARSIEDVFKLGYGSSREINDALTGLARAAGFDATQVLVTTRDDDFFAPGLEDWNQLNDDIVCVRSGSQDLYVDPGNPFYPFGSLPWYVAGVQGLRIRASGGELVTTTVPRSSDFILVRKAQLKLDSSGSLSGKIQVELKDERARILRQLEQDNDDSIREKDLSDSVKSWLPPDASFEISSVTGWDKNSTVIHVEGTLRIPNFVTVSGKHTLLTTSIFTSNEEKAFQNTTRVNDIYFDYPYENQDSVQMELPPDLQIEELPSPHKTEQPSLELKIDWRGGGTQLNIDRQLAVNQFLFAAASYPQVRAFFNAVASADAQEVVLSTRH